MTYKVFLVSLLLLLSYRSFAQTSTLTPAETENFKNQATAMVRFLAGSLNDLGNPEVSAKEKQIITSQTYLKFFKNDKVQIEDDLDDNRKIVINKDVQAYLKDIDFFFKRAIFEFNVESTEILENKEQKLMYIKVKTTRILKAISIDGTLINSPKVRFIEINIDPITKDMKIASMYSIKITEEQELKEWWNSIPNVWRQVFKSDYKNNDSISFQDLKRIVNLEEVDISNKKDMYHLIPLNRLRKLKKVRCFNTQVTDLQPIRNLVNLEEVQCSKTSVSDLTPLKYLSNLKILDCSKTLVKNLEPIADLNTLEKVDISNTNVNTLESLRYLDKLTTLDCSQTAISDLEPIDSLPIHDLHFSGTQVADCKVIANMKNLEYINLDRTKVSTIQPFTALSQVKKLYCAETQIKESDIKQFIMTHPECLVVYKTKELSKWWAELSPEWKLKMKEYVKVSNNPSEEELHQIVNLKKIYIQKSSTLTSLAPLSNLSYLKELNCSQSNISSLDPLKTLNYLDLLEVWDTPINSIAALSGTTNLRVLNISNTQVADLSPLSNLNQLEEIYCSNTPITSLKPLENLKKLDKLVIDRTKISKEEIASFIAAHPNCFVVYQSSELKTWWQTMSKEWKTVFNQYLKAGENPSDEQLQQMVDLPALEIINNFEIKDLAPLNKLTKLKELHISGSNVENFVPLRELTQLEILECSNSPLRGLNSLKKLTQLKSLDCQNTAIRNLTGIEEMQQLEKLDISGSKVRWINKVGKLKKLTYFDCSNSKVIFLNATKYLKLQHLKCYNTRIISWFVNSYKDKHKKCEIIFY